MKMIIVLDKICLLGVVGVSLYAGYNIGRKAEKFEQSLKPSKTNFNND